MERDKNETPPEIWDEMMKSPLTQQHNITILKGSGHDFCIEFGTRMPFLYVSPLAVALGPGVLGIERICDRHGAHAPKMTLFPSDEKVSSSKCHWGSRALYSCALGFFGCQFPFQIIADAGTSVTHVPV